MPETLTGNLEENVLCSLCWNDYLSPLIAMQIKPELFQTRHLRIIAKAALEHVIRYNEPPKNHLTDYLEAELNKGESSVLLWKQIERMAEIHPHIQPKIVEDRLYDFMQQRMNTLRIKQATEINEKGDWKKAQEIMFAGDMLTKHEPGTWMHDPDQALRFLDRDPKEAEFSLGIDALDDRGVRPARKELLVFMAPKKRGKSMALVQIGITAAYTNHKKVLYVSLEMSEEQVAKRVVQSVCGMADHEVTDRRVPFFKKDENGTFLELVHDELSMMVLNKENRKVAAQTLEAISRGTQKLLIKEFPTSSLTMSRLIMYLETLKRTNNFEPDLLIVDYANLLHMDFGQLRTETGRIFRELRGLAMSRNMAVVTATQGNRSSEDAKVVGSTHVSEDWSVMGTADIVVSICRTPEEKVRNLARLYVVAARTVADQYMVQISQNYNTCSFAIDSVYMSKIVEKNIKHMLEEEEDD